MPEDPYKTIRALMASTRPDELRLGLELLKKEIARVGSREAKPLFELVSTLFYIDPLDRPDLVPVLDDAVNLVVGFGSWVIPLLVENLDAGDLKAQLAMSHALGRIGPGAIGPLIDAYNASPDATRRCFVLYALGKIKSPQILKAASLALDAAGSADLELRDTAIRAIGKFVESIPPDALSETLRLQFVERLRANLADSSPVIRAKAVRSLGKLARYGHLTVSERETLRAVCQSLLGNDENFEWDRAYIVRKEADEALRHLG
jgi:hypothetical protein